MRLRRYLAKYGECDSLTEYLILEGYPDEYIKVGLEPFVSSWEDSVQWIVESVDLEDYDNDLFARTCLHLALQHASPEQKAIFSSRIKKADEVFIQNTIEEDSPCGTYPEEINESNKNMHWWLYRIPNGKG
ncbi:MAG TPA: hypothetical protein PLQ82_07200 [Desulfobacteraceae bacterium]|nr:hypothetical protein [Desulfobacteraceae bacterium]HPQ28251.1 hypothetical protein [Desulfobacteraceae bacterium]